MNILGISDVTGNHSHSCIALLQDGELTFALAQERLSRVKNDSRFPTEAIRIALDFAGLRLQDINHFACGYPPARYYSSLAARSKFDLPRSLLGVLPFRPFRLAKYLLPNIRKGIFDPKSANGLLDLGVPMEKIRFVDHHLAHVSAAYFSSGFDDCLGISYGGFAPHSSGQNVAGAVYRCEGDEITFLEDIPMYATGCYYSGVTVALGFQYMAQEGKSMGLATHGDPTLCYDQVAKITTRFTGDSWQPYHHWVDYVMSPRAEVFAGSRSGRKLRKLIKKFGPEQVAAAAQRLWCENVVRYIKYLRDKYAASRFALAGGLFLNIQINKQIVETDGIDDIFVHPHTGDGSTTIGAMIEVYRQFTGSPVCLPLKDMGLGVEFSDEAIENELRRYGSVVKYQKVSVELPQIVAEKIASGLTIGWFHGREEYGLRSLGHRCILGHPGREQIKMKITEKIKGRDRFIPLAASCLAEKGDDYFLQFRNSPFMTRAYAVRPEKIREIPACVHADNTCRVQAVDASFYLPFRKILEHFYNKSGIPMVVNTSLNRHGQPICHRPSQAIELLLDSELEELVIGSFIVKKSSL
jgi:carbamoyltransferase